MFIIYISYGGEFWQLTPSDPTPDEGSLITVLVETNQPDGTYYWYIEHVDTNDNDFETLPPSITNRSTFTVTSRFGTITLPAFRNDGATEGPEEFLVHVSRTSSSASVKSTSIVIQDTSREPEFVNAGLDQVILAGNLAVLNGFYSGDLNSVTVDWIQQSGDTVIIGNVNAVQSNITFQPGASGEVTMRLYVNYGLPGQLYDDVTYYLTPKDDISILVGARMSTGPESLEFTVNPRIEV